MVEGHLYQSQEIKLWYYELRNNLQPLVLLHAQGVDAKSFANVWKRLSKRYHVYSLDCYGHGESLHDAAQYNVVDIGNAIIRFLQDVVREKVFLLGHSSGGLIAAYVASHADLCEYLILEDPPFFSSQGEGRRKAFNYVDLSTICHSYLAQTNLGFLSCTISAISMPGTSSWKSPGKRCGESWSPWRQRTGKSTRREI